MNIGRDRLRRKLSKKIERSVNIHALVINGGLNFFYEEGFSDGL